jgi:zinc/manganese transport system permease protein
MSTFINDITFLMPAFVLCLVLVGIHCYLGLHVLARNVLFIDLALAQVAALGTTVAFAFGYDHHDSMAFFVSLGFTFFAAFLFTLAGRLKEKLSVEAFIGIIYAFSSALVILVIDKLSHGAEHLKYTLVGQIIWTNWSDVLHISLIYIGVTGIHFYFRKKLLAASFQGGQHWFWDFLFYALFGVVITCSVGVSGVLLVFAFLIVPAVLSSLITSQLRHQLLLGWLIGFVLCAIGIFLSYKLDLPPGATLVVTFTLAPVIYVFIFGIRKLIPSRRIG